MTSDSEALIAWLQTLEIHRFGITRETEVVMDGDPPMVVRPYIERRPSGWVTVTIYAKEPA